MSMEKPGPRAGGLAEAGCRRRGEVREAPPGELVVAGDEAVRLPVREHGRARALGEGDQLGARLREPGTAAREDGGSLGGMEQGDGALDGLARRRRGGIRREAARRGRARLVHAREQHVDGQLQEDGARPARARDAPLHDQRMLVALEPALRQLALEIGQLTRAEHGFDRRLVCAIADRVASRTPAAVTHESSRSSLS